MLHPLFQHKTQLLWAQNLPLKHQLIYPVFVVDGIDQQQPIPSMHNIFRFSVDLLIKHLAELVHKGLKAILIFGIIDKALKDDVGTHAGGMGVESCVHHAIRIIAKTYPELLIITDVCLCAYTSHGHCGVLDFEGNLDNTKSCERIAEVALSYAKAGAHIVAPSDMMDGRVKHIKHALKDLKVPIMSYSSKFCSGLYGPFRDVCQSAPSKFDRSSYQLPTGSKELALAASTRDVNEGADYLMVKPITAYLDIAVEIKRRFPDHLLACYHVSGEYAMICVAAENGLLDKKRVVLEYMQSFKRAGIDLIITYFTPELLDWL